MVNRKEMTEAVSDLKKEISASPANAGPKNERQITNEASEQPSDRGDDLNEEQGLHEDEVVKLLQEHGVEVDDLKDVWEKFSNELKDLATQKPLVTVSAAFLLGFISGRMSRR